MTGRASRLEIATATLQDLDLVAVGVANEEEARKFRATMVEIHDLCRLEPDRDETLMFRPEVIDRDCQMAVTVTD
jgi:hypothetical protein